jgi:hypothetical protein
MNSFSSYKRESSWETTDHLVGLILGLVTSPDWPGCQGVKVWGTTRNKFVYRDCGKCLWCEAEAIADEARSTPT